MKRAWEANEDDKEKEDAEEEKRCQNGWYRKRNKLSMLQVPQADAGQDRSSPRLGTDKGLQGDAPM